MLKKEYLRRQIEKTRMKVLKYPLWLLWKIWFYVLVLVVILVLSPFLILSLSTENGYPFFMKLARIWALIIFYGMGFRYTLHQKQVLDPKQSYMFVANHSSMMDIMLMLILVKNPFVFIGKKELVKLPVFGFFYKRAVIMVDRSSAKSRQESIRRAELKLQQGYSICIFPEGGVPDDLTVVLDEFKDGAFRLAIEFQIPIAAFSFVGLKQHFPFSFFSGKPGNIPVYMHPLVATKGLVSADKQALKKQVRTTILSALSS